MSFPCFISMVHASLCIENVQIRVVLLNQPLSMILFALETCCLKFAQCFKVVFNRALTLTNPFDTPQTLCNYLALSAHQHDTRKRSSAV